MKEHAAPDGREFVVRRRGADWTFHLPEQHEIELTADRRYVNLSTPGESTLFRVQGIDESDSEEIVIELGDAHAWAGPAAYGSAPLVAIGYQLPEIQDEFDRLRALWREAGLDQQRFVAYAQGASHDEHLRMLRRELRRARPRPERPAD